ncbi:MAG: phospholipid carrier-dependent glycosyltransferase [Bacteroidia bacterium]|nr:phospholipid carrier-dependent glycosyltransferase [Bacteroidia bacterium]
MAEATFIFWLQAGAMHLFGINEFAARFPNALVGVATLLVLFYLGNKLYDRSFGLLWALVYAGSILPHFTLRPVLFDPLFNLFIFLSVYQLANLSQSSDHRQRLGFAAWGGVFIGAAVLTKGPVALLLVGVCGLVYWVLSRRLNTFQIGELLLYAFLAFVVSSLWYLPETLRNGFWFINEFLEYQIGLAAVSEDTAHEQPFWYHPVVLFVWLFSGESVLFGGFAKRLV